MRPTNPTRAGVYKKTSKAYKASQSTIRSSSLSHQSITISRKETYVEQYPHRISCICTMLSPVLPSLVSRKTAVSQPPSRTKQAYNKRYPIPTIKITPYYNSQTSTRSYASLYAQNMPFDATGPWLYSGRRSARSGAMRGCHWARKVIATRSTVVNALRSVVDVLE